MTSQSVSALVFGVVISLAVPSLGQAQATPAAAGPPVTTTPQTDAPPAVPSEKPAVLPPQKMGDIFMARKMYREAIDSYKEALDSVPVLWNKIGIAYHQLGQLDVAVRHYQEALKLKKDYAEAINNLGTIRYARKDYKGAEKDYRKALKLVPKSASIWSNLGTALFARKKYNEAMEAYNTALKLDADVFEHRSMGGSLMQERTVEERAMFHFYLAKLYAGAGQTERALQYMRMALEEGFSDRKKFIEEPEFSTLQDLPEFKELLAYQPRVL